MRRSHESVSILVDMMHAFFTKSPTVMVAFVVTVGAGFHRGIQDCFERCRLVNAPQESSRVLLNCDE